MKRRTLTLTLCILACIALIGVGFASWVITYDSPKDVSGNISVDTVNDESHKITIVTSSIPGVVFGAKTADSSTTVKWLKYVNSSKDENLTIEIEFTVTNPTTLDSTNPFSFVLGFDTETKENSEAYYNAAKDANIVAALPNSTSGISCAQKQNEGSPADGTYIVTITFAWGTAFEGNNPIDYYNTKFSTPTEEQVTAAYTLLSSDTFQNLANVAFKLTITPNSAE